MGPWEMEYVSRDSLNIGPYIDADGETRNLMVVRQPHKVFTTFSSTVRCESRNIDQ